MSNDKSHPSMSQPTPLEWELIRPVVEDLYLIQGSPLRVVKERIKAEYGLYATYVLIIRLYARG
jgi:hypothetical protein